MEMECASEERLEKRADPFPDAKVMEEKRHDLMVVLIIEEEEDGVIFTTEELSVRAVEEVGVEETMIDSRVKTPDERKNNGIESPSIVKVIDVKETEMEEIEITNTPSDISPSDVTVLVTEVEFDWIVVD